MTRVVQTVAVSGAAAALIVAYLSDSVLVTVVACTICALIIVVSVLHAWRRASRKVDDLLEGVDDHAAEADDVPSGSAPHHGDRDSH